MYVNVISIPPSLFKLPALCIPLDFWWYDALIFVGGWFYSSVSIPAAFGLQNVGTLQLKPKLSCTH